MFPLPKLILILAATSTALMAGLFFSWSVAVMPGIARLQDAAFIQAMKAMNKAILNPLFFSCFFGAALLLPAAALLQYGQPVPIRFRLLLAATVCYLIGVMGVTMTGNVPLNESLDAFDIRRATLQELAAKRTGFENAWNRLNTIRTLSAAASLVLVIIACLNRDDI